jgi:polyhydroxyalkanoate synthesis regulator phasin
MEPLKSVANQIVKAEADPVVGYFRALDQARVIDVAAIAAGRHTSQSRLANEKATMSGLANAGIAVVDTMCLRWFHSLMESQIRMNYASANRNIIKDLGTTLLGLAAANKYIVGTYGAINTAASGIEQNISQAFLLAPNANKIKAHVFMALNAKASSLREDVAKNISTLPEVYVELERYADLCTQHTAREIMNTALDQTRTGVSAATEGNRVVTTPTATAAKIEQEQFKTAVEDIKQFRQNAEKQISEQGTALSNTTSKALQIEGLLKANDAESAKLRDRIKELETQIDLLRNSQTKQQ